MLPVALDQVHADRQPGARQFTPIRISEFLGRRSAPGPEPDGQIALVSIVYHWVYAKEGALPATSRDR